MRIIGVAWHGYALPFRNEYVTSQGRAPIRYGLLVFLHADSSLTGIGEASPVGPGDKGRIEMVAAALEDLAPRLLGMEAAAVDTKMLIAPPELRFGLETALLDLEGRSCGRPVAELLGGTPCSFPVNALITAVNPEPAADEAQAAVRQGFTSLKLKVGVGRAALAHDEALVSAVRRAVGPEIRLRLDPNQTWGVAQAIESIQRLARYGLEYVEQPVAAADLSGLATVRRNVPVPIAADEALGTKDDLRRILAADAADIVVIKAARLGSLRAALDVALTANKAGKPAVITSSLECGVGISAAAHLAATLPCHPFAHGLATGLLFQEDLTASRLLPQKGMLSAPSGPGLGVQLDPRLERKYNAGIRGSVGSWSWSW